MDENNKETRERVRELVRQVLATVPTEGESSVEPGHDHAPEHLVVNSLKDKIGKEWDRDESSKTLLTWISVMRSAIPLSPARHSSRSFAEPNGPRNGA